MAEPVILIANGDLRLAANQRCWPAQSRAEEAVMQAIRREGREVKRGHACDPVKQHGFIDSQKYGMEVFRDIPPEAPLVVVEAVWQYSHHVLARTVHAQGSDPDRRQLERRVAGTGRHAQPERLADQGGRAVQHALERGFHGRFLSERPAPVAGGRDRWQHDVSHVRGAEPGPNCRPRPRRLGRELAGELQRDKAIMGIFDEGCMGMYNAIIPDELLHPTGVFKERLSQSALYAEMQQVSDAEARGGARHGWTSKRHEVSVPGRIAETDLTDDQILEQCKMYIAALRIADDFGCDTIGIQYQQGLKDLTPASDLVEGLLNNVDRPPVTASRQAGVCSTRARRCRTSTKWTSARAWTHWSPTASGRQAGLRSGEHAARCALRRAYGTNGDEEFVWVFEISGAVPPNHLAGGYAGSVSERQPAMYFRLGGGSLKGVSKAGRDRVEPRLRGRRQTEGGHRAGEGGRAAAGGDRDGGGGSRRRSGRSCTR